MQLTKNEQEILVHRLALSDALSEVMADTYPEKWSDTEKTEEVCRELLREVETTHAVEAHTDLQSEILIDCLEGSTFFASMEDEVALGKMSRQKMSAYLRAAESLEDKFAAAGMRCACTLS